MKSGAVSVVGLGKLGACMAACMASKGIRVVGVDINEETVTAMRHGRAPTYEPGLAELLATVKPANLMVTTDIAAITETDTTFIVVPTPSEPNGAFSLRYVKEAAQGIGRALRDKKGYHVVAVTSTGLPGATEYGILPILERASGKKLGDFGLCYNPEFIALGTVIHDFLSPDFVLIGESDQFAGAQVAKIYEQVCEIQPDVPQWHPRRKPPVAHMSIPSAELAKVAINSYLVTKIAIANMLGDFCEELPGADVADVTHVLGLDSRIGPKFLKAAMPASGPCLPRDSVALAYFGKVLGVNAVLPMATDAANSARIERLAKQVIAVTPAGGTVAILGLAYKPGTNVLDGAPGYLLARRLSARQPVQKIKAVRVFDPVAKWPWGGTTSSSVEECIRDAHVIVVANPDPAFVDLGDCAGKIVIDPWRIVTNHIGADYRPFGIGATDEAAEARLKKMWA